MSSSTAAVFSTADALRFGWTQMKEHLGPLLTLGLVGGVLAGLNQALTSNGRGAGVAVLSLVLQLCQLGLTMATMRLALRIVDGEPITIPSFKEFSPEYVSFLLTSLLAGLFVAAGLLLLIVPGVLWALKFCFAGFVVVDRKLSPVEALKESARLTEGLRGELAAFGVALLVLNVVGLLALGVGVMVTVPMTYVAAAQVYRRLQARAGVAPASFPRAPPTVAASH